MTHRVRAMLVWGGSTQQGSLRGRGGTQALCKRTVDVIRRLNDTGHAEKMQYYMSKADQVGPPLPAATPSGGCGGAAPCRPPLGTPALAS